MEPLGRTAGASAVALVVISELQCAHLVASYVAPPPRRRAAWWRRSSARQRRRRDHRDVDDLIGDCTVDELELHDRLDAGREELLLAHPPGLCAKPRISGHVEPGSGRLRRPTRLSTANTRSAPRFEQQDPVRRQEVGTPRDMRWHRAPRRRPCRDGCHEQTQTADKQMSPDTRIRAGRISGSGCLGVVKRGFRTQVRAWSKPSLYWARADQPARAQRPPPAGETCRGRGRMLF